MFGFKCGKEFGRIARAQFMLDVEVSAEIFDDSIHWLTLFEKLPDSAATFVQFQVNPIFDVKQKCLVADGCGYDLRRAREDSVSFGHRLERRRDRCDAISSRV